MRPRASQDVRKAEVWAGVRGPEQSAPASLAFAKITRSLSYMTAAPEALS